MLRSEQDYLLRQIAAVAEALRRLRERLTGAAQPEELLPELAPIEAELLGRETHLLRALDATTAGTLIGNAQRVLAWAEILTLKAELLRAAGRAPEAKSIELRVAALRKVAESLGERERG